MKRNCDYCKKEYNADDRNIKRGWGLCCSKSCAAKKRERRRTMREIKFRGKKIGTEYGEYPWVEGSLIQRIDSTVIFDSVFSWNIHPETVGQFTGLTDKNGKEIYEGDIVIYPDDNRPCEVIYKTGLYGAGFNTDAHDGVHSLGDVMTICMVIGNIHDNPELLEKKGSER